MTRSGLVLALTLFAGFGSTGCGGGDDGGGDSGGKCGGAKVDTAGCSAVVAPSSDDVETLQGAMIDAKSGDSVCLCPGTYALGKEISLAVPNVTVKGLGANIEDVVLDYATQTDGDDGFSVTSDGFTVENLSIKNSPGNGIVVTGAENVTFRKLKVSWDAGSVTSNGAYAVYPVKSKKVLIEDTEVVGASDAGLYVGQCTDAIVRRNKVHGNVAGIEFENTTNGEAYENESYDNAAGLLVFALPKLEKKDGKSTSVHDNHIHDNNRQNFGEKGSVVASAPTGTGVLILAADDTRIFSNNIENNDSVGVLAVSLTTLALVLKTEPDPLTDPDPEGTYIHGNTFTANGANPHDVLSTFNIKPLETVVWDGVVKSPAPADPVFCLGDPPLPTFRNVHAPDGLLDNAVHTTDATPYQCKLPDLPPLDF